MSQKIFVSLLVVALVGSVTALDCLDASGDQVAWWGALKFPKKVSTTNHLYYDANDDANQVKQFKLMNKFVSAQNTALYNTLNQLNSMPRSQVSILAFNDEFPDGKTISGGAHMKGVIAMDAKSGEGFYLMHSTPKYPDITDSNVDPQIPETGMNYGQNYMCITINAQSLNKILANIAVSHPNVYYDNGNLAPANAKGSSIVNDFKIRLNGQAISHLSKHPSFNEYLYSGVISPHFDVNLAVESWSHPVEPPLCSGKYMCENVKTVKFSDKVQWTVGEDHSKWAVSVHEDEKQGLVCFGDINRAASQKKRGGGALCFNGNSNLFSAVNSLVSDRDHCDDDEFLMQGV